MPHPELTLERRIDAELCGLDAKMCVYADDLHGHVVERGADDEFESASTIKIYILGCLYAQAEAGKASLDAELTPHMIMRLFHSNCTIICKKRRISPTHLYYYFSFSDPIFQRCK